MPQPPSRKELPASLTLCSLCAVYACVLLFPVCVLVSDFPSSCSFLTCFLYSMTLVPSADQDGKNVKAAMHRSLVNLLAVTSNKNIPRYILTLLGNRQFDRIAAICIRITCLFVLYPLSPHFYIVKLGFTGVYIIFLFLF